MIAQSCQKFNCKKDSIFFYLVQSNNNDNLGFIIGRCGEHKFMNGEEMLSKDEIIVMSVLYE